MAAPTQYNGSLAMCRRSWYTNDCNLFPYKKSHMQQPAPYFQSARYITVLLTLSILLYCNAGFSQGSTNAPASTPQSIFAEVGGSGIIVSVNYDRRFSKTFSGLGFRVGVGSNFSGTSQITSVPVGINYLLGHTKNFLELGLAETPLFAKDYHTPASAGYVKNYSIQPIAIVDMPEGTTTFVTCVDIGYRYQPVNNGFTFRVGLTGYLYKHEGDGDLYVSLGYRF